VIEETVRAWFATRGFDIKLYESDGEFWADLMGRDGRVVSAKYGRGVGRDEAVARARQRYAQEQEGSAEFG
jgi:hypothetical protein